MDDLELDNIYVYQIALPEGIDEYVTPCFMGYTIYIDKNLTHERRQKAFIHALKHIKNNDFEKSDVQAIESQAHR